MTEIDPVYEGGLREESVRAGVAELKRLLPSELLQGDAEAIVSAILTAASGGEVVAPMDQDTAEQHGVRSNCFATRLSRWTGDEGLRIAAVNVEPLKVTHGGPCSISVDVRAETAGEFAPVVSILIMNKEGVGVARLLSPPQHIKLNAGETDTISVIMDEMQLLPSSLVFSVALFAHYDPDDSNTARRYEILSRSFALEIVGKPQPGLFTPPGKWSRG